MASVVLWRRLRLSSGLVLMAFVLCHLLQLGLGVVSLGTIEAYLGLLTFPWESTLGETLLLGAALVHIVAGLQSIAARRSLAMSPTDIVQLVLALLVPLLLVSHVVMTRLTQVLVSDFGPSYRLMLAAYWRFVPQHAFRQLLAVIVVWTHGSIGIYGRLVLLRVWSRIAAPVLAILFGVPILALLGFVKAGAEVLARMADDAPFRQAVEADWAKVGSVMTRLGALDAAILAAYGIAVAAAVGVLAARVVLNRRHRVRVVYDGGATAEGRRGLTILELSLSSGVPHAHVCSGRGRCGTCRVAVDAGTDQLSTITDIERGTLAAVRAGPPVRLACQARVLGPGVRVTRLLPAFVDAVSARDWTEPHEPARPAMEAAP